jgi:hypothetical protein
MPSNGFDRDERFAYKRIQDVEHVVLVEAVVEVRGPNEVEAAGEYRATLQNCAFFFVEQVIGPSPAWRRV